MKTFIEELKNRVIGGGEVTEAEAMRLISLENEDEIQMLLEAAREITFEFNSDEPGLCSLINAKSYLCGEDCGFCSQSVRYETQVDRYKLKPVEEVVEAAKEFERKGTENFCVVTSGGELNDQEFEQVLEIYRRLKAETKLNLDGSLGFLSAERVKRLKEAGVRRFNSNLQSSREFYPKIVTTHTYETRLDTLCSIEADLLLPVDAMTRVAAALADQEGARALARRLKLANEERDRLVSALGDEVKIVSYMSLREMRRAIYRIGNEAFRDRVMLAWAGAGGEKAQAWRALVAHASMWTPPKLPLSGDEVMAAGVPAGPKVGEVMREVEAWWIDADFPDDKLSIIERLKAVAQGLA